jgi:hypothetical protein
MFDGENHLRLRKKMNARTANAPTASRSRVLLPLSELAASLPLAFNEPPAPIVTAPNVTGPCVTPDSAVEVALVLTETGITYLRLKNMMAAKTAAMARTM